MSLEDFLKKPMFSKLGEHLHSMAEFSAVDDAGSRTEVDKAIAGLNLQARPFFSSKSFTKDYLDLISQAETEAANQQWPDAHKAVWQATALVNSALESHACARFRICISWYLAFWLLALGIAGCWLKHYEVQAASDLFFGFTYWRYLLMGALGGVVIAIWGLITHTTNLDFDRQFAVWYWFKPVLGALTGLVAVITAVAGLLAIQGQGAMPSSANGKMVLYILAFLAGFSERFFLDIVDRVMTALLSSGQSSSSSSKPGAAKGSPSGSGK